MTAQVAAGVEGCSCIGCGMARRKAAAGVPPESECGSCDQPAETCELIIGGHSNGWCRRCLERAGHVRRREDA